MDDGRLQITRGMSFHLRMLSLFVLQTLEQKLIQDDILAGKQAGSIEEPTVITTYAFSPRGRQIMTIMGKKFSKERMQHHHGQIA